MPAGFHQSGIHFQYPENWQLDEQESGDGGRSVTVYAPGGGAFWSVSVHPSSADPNKLAAAALKAMRQEYEDVEAEVVREVIVDHEMVGYDLNFFYLDLTNTAGVRSLRTPKGTYTVFYQAEDREYRKVQHVFEAMTVSLLREMK